MEDPSTPEQQDDIGYDMDLTVVPPDPLPLRILLPPSTPASPMEMGRPSMVAHPVSGPWENPTVVDRLLRPYFVIAAALMNVTIVRLGIAVILFPLYLFVAFARSVLPGLVVRSHWLFTEHGREKLVARGTSARLRREALAEDQFRGDFNFAAEDIEHTEDAVRGVERMSGIWPVTREFFDVCPGIQASVVRAGNANGVPVVLLHGNPSWSYMYRNIIPTLSERGLDVYALDWVGFGMSDKPLVAEQISFELHIRTLTSLFERYDLSETHILAHDWGGCIALCTIPYLPWDACRSLILLNSFFPPQVSDSSPHCALLYLIWLSLQGIFGGLVPESLIVRLMAPFTTTSPIAQAYAAPFSGRKPKPGLYRLTKLIPAMPDIVYGVFQSHLGLILDGICQPQVFSSLHGQVRMRQLGLVMRDYWSSGQAAPAVRVIFGQSDPLLHDFREVLLRTIRTSRGEAQGAWIQGTGHYPTEEKPHFVARHLIEFVQTVEFLEPEGYASDHTESCAKEPS